LSGADCMLGLYARGPMRLLFFGTYDPAAHPRVRVLRGGLARRGATVREVNAPLGLSTADRVGILRNPLLLPALAWRIARCWAALWQRSAGFRRPGQRPDAVVVGYLGHFDVLLARRLFPDVPVVLDHLIGASDTATDRGVAGGVRQRLLQALDAAALGAADVVVVDTEEHRAALPPQVRPRAVVVAVGAPDEWFAVTPPATAWPHPLPSTVTFGSQFPPDQLPNVTVDHEAGGGKDAEAGQPLRVVFFGLFTPLQGAPVIGRALAALAGEPVEVTMVGRGQDRAETQRLAAANTRVRWVDWVAPGDLPALVAGHDVCLGIFGSGPKAARVVANKVFQGAAAGCALVTADTAPQRRLLGDAAAFVPPGDADALAALLRALAHDPARVRQLRHAARTLAEQEFTAAAVVAPLHERLRSYLPPEA